MSVVVKRVDCNPNININLRGANSSQKEFIPIKTGGKKSRVASSVSFISVLQIRRGKRDTRRF